MTPDYYSEDAPGMTVDEVIEIIQWHAPELTVETETELGDALQVLLEEAEFVVIQDDTRKNGPVLLTAERQEGFVKLDLRIGNRSRRGVNAVYVYSHGRLGLIQDLLTDELVDEFSKPREGEEPADVVTDIVADLFRRAEKAGEATDKRTFLESLGNRPVSEIEGRILNAAIDRGKATYYG